MTSDSRPTTIEELAPLALTFDDVLLQPVESNVIPSQVDTTTKVSRNIDIAIPLVSAAMDTVTETRMAVAMAREGGLGILHRNLSIEDQAAMVDQVKRSEAGMVDEPITISPDATLADAEELCHTYRISGVPVVDEKAEPRRHHHQPRHALRGEPAAPHPRGHDPGPAGHGSGGHQSVRRPFPAGRAQDRKAAVDRRRRQAARPVHPQGLRQGRQVPQRHQGSSGTSTRGCCHRFLRQLVGTRHGTGGGGCRPHHRRHRSRPHQGRSRHDRQAQGRACRQGGRRSAGPEPTASRSASGRARSAPLVWLPVSASPR